MMKELAKTAAPLYGKVVETAASTLLDPITAKGLGKLAEKSLVVQGELADKAIDKVSGLIRDKLEENVEPEKPEIEQKTEAAEKVRDNLENDCPSTYDDRIRQTPREGERGHWENERGESKYIPTDAGIKEILAKDGLDGIEYKDGVPDFSECAKATVEIEDMSDARESKEDKAGNFEQADAKCAEQWNNEGRDGKNDWKSSDVRDWRRENGYTWHECNDRKTCQLVPTEINAYFGHLGGVGECKIASTQEDGFDE
jgi:NAD+--asparagine ADP-ribosyltransferase